mgnify:CR=1 FL=1
MAVSELHSYPIPVLDMLQGRSPAPALSAGIDVNGMTSARLRDAAEPILMPGDPERASRQARAEKVPVDAGPPAELDAAAAAAAVAGSARSASRPRSKPPSTTRTRRSCASSSPTGAS